MTFYNINLENFKRFKSESIDLSGKITLLLGPNSSGKSSVLKALLGIKQTFSASNEHEGFASQGDYVDLGTFKDYVFLHDTKLPVSLSLTISAKELLGIASIFHSMEKLTVKLTYDFDSISEQARILSIEVYEEKNANTALISVIRKKTRNSYVIKVSKGCSDIIEGYFRVDGKLESSDAWLEGFTVHHQEKLRFSTTSDATRKKDDLSFQLANLPFAIFTSILDRLSSEFNNEIFYLGPLRRSPARSYTRTTHSIDVGPNGEHTPSVFSNLERRQKKVTRGKSEYKDNYDYVTGWLRTIFPDREVSAETYEELVKLKVTRISNGRGDHNDVISDVGFGFSQVFPILVQAAVMPLNSILIIEQPELHLHPMAQSRLAKVIASAARKGSKFIIETHSEHFLRGLQLEISKDSQTSKPGLMNTDLRVFYVPEYPAKIHEMKLNEWGEFEQEWPSGFFDEAYKLSYELIKRKADAIEKKSEKLRNEIKK